MQGAPIVKPISLSYEHRFVQQAICNDSYTSPLHDYSLQSTLIDSMLEFAMFLSTVLMSDDHTRLVRRSSLLGSASKVCPRLNIRSQKLACARAGPTIGTIFARDTMDL